MTDFETLINAIQKGNFIDTRSEVKRLLSQGNTPDDIIQKGINVALDIVGRKFSSGEWFRPRNACYCQGIARRIRCFCDRRYCKSKIEPKGKIVIGTVRGDLHDIGKNIVGMTLESAGFQVIDLGVDVTVDEFIETVKSEKAGHFGFVLPFDHYHARYE